MGGDRPVNNDDWTITVPCFPTNSENDNRFIIQDCNPKLAIIENENIYKKNHSLFKKFLIQKYL